MTAPAEVVSARVPGPLLRELRKSEPGTAVEIWRRRVASSPERLAFRYFVDGSWRTMSYAAADAVAREIAAGLAARGVVAGDRVCLLAQTRLEWVLLDVGILLVGGVTVPIYPSNTPEQCAFIVRDSGARTIVVEDAAQAAKLTVAPGGAAGLERVVQIDGDVESGLGGVETLASLREAGRLWLAAHPGELDTRAAAAAPESMFTIVYTSGTTGTPKGVVLTHQNLVAAVCSGGRALEIRPDDEHYLFLPLAHILGRELAWAGVELGFATIFSRGLNNIRDDLTAVRPTMMAGVPRIFEKFYAAVTAGIKQGSAFKRAIAAWAIRAGMAYAAAARAGRNPGGLEPWLANRLVLSKLRARLGLDRCRFLISGGAPLAPEIAEFFHAVGLLILEGYGLTETTASAFLNTPSNYRFGTVGTALDVVEARIADDGEILMRGPSVFERYYANAGATAESVEPDGWFHTGDIGVVEDGFLRITDRKKDLIVTAGGKKVAPQPIESAIKATSPLVSQVLVYGDKRPYCVALVTLSDAAIKRFGGAGGTALAESPEVKAAVEREVKAVNARLAPFESVKRIAILPNDLTEAAGELTPKLSVRRKVVIEKYRDVIERLYAAGRED
jgi:long-chain acyl-CoA synthetase